MFAHLHIHNEYSALDGLGSAVQFAQRAKEMGFEYLGLTNHGNVTGCLKWQRECLKVGINPVFGCEVYVVSNLKNKITEKASHMVIFVRNMTGWKELCRILTVANLENFYKKPIVDFKTILDADRTGWIITTACLNSWIYPKTGMDFFKTLSEDMPDRLYLEIHPHTEEIQVKHNKIIQGIQKEYNIPLLAANDCHYVIRGDWKSQECLLAIQRKAKWSDENRFKFTIKGLHLRSELEMEKAFIRQGVFSEDEVWWAMDNSIKIAKECSDFRIPKQEINLPEVPNIVGNYDDILTDLCDSGSHDIPEWNMAYSVRLQTELNLIKSKNFSRYFLIVKDVVDHCRNEGIMVGPGRGSVGGSLAAYLLGITTDIDPIKFKLSFSRFLSEDRIDWPDIDLDFEDSKREQVTQYIQDTYGKGRVCGISVDSRFKKRSVLWDVARVFEIPKEDIKNIIFDVEHYETLKLFFDENKKGKQFAKAYPEPFRLMSRLENQLRHFGQHPAAVVISADDLTQGHQTSLRLQKGNVVSCWDMEDSEYCGLIKLDILGLSTLSVLSDCRRLIRLEEGYGSWDFEQLKGQDDPEVFKMISAGDTSGVFQISANPSTELCKRMGISSFNDLVAAIALVRPGPTDSGMTEEFIKRKHGQKWERLNDIYEEVTEDTYGLLVYQEQVMQVISRVAGLSESTADKIRKVIGKKRDPKEFEKYKQQFVDGCLELKTFSPDECEKFWETLLFWAGYGFNKAHSVEYAIIAYWTAWCKVHFPTEFICACLTYGKKDEKQRLINQAQQLGLKIMFPKVGLSEALNWAMSPDHEWLHVPFCEVNSVGVEQANKCCDDGGDANVGFFKIKKIPNPATKLGQILKEVGAYDKNMKPSDEVIEKNFSFTLTGDKEKVEINKQAQIEKIKNDPRFKRHLEKERIRKRKNFSG